MTDAEDIAARARELAARAAGIAEDASDSQALREELDRLDAELARLDEERRRLDEQVRDRGDAAADAGEPRDDAGRPPWADTLVDLVSDVTERISALGSGGWPWRSSETVDRFVAVDGVVPVVIDNRAGSINVRAGGGNAVTVSAELFAPSAHLLEEMLVTAEREHDTIVIRTQWPEQRRGRRARLTVTVPTGTAVRAGTSGGSVTVNETHASVAVSTKGGSVTVAGANGEADVRTMGGSVRIADHVGSVHAATRGGSVHVGGHLTGTVDATTAGGSIHIEGVDRAVVNASTSGGSVRVHGRLVGLNRIRTAGGSVTVSIPSDSQVHVDAKGMSASTDFSSLDVNRGRITGTLGDGSDGTVELRTSGGSVTLAKT